MIGGTVSPVSSAGRAPDLQAGGRGLESCIGHTFSVGYESHGRAVELKKCFLVFVQTSS